MSAGGAHSVYAVDMDGDGDVDVLSASSTDDKVAWYENLDGSGGSFRTHIITTNAEGALSVFAIDMDGDGDVDVLSASPKDNTVAWYENLDGGGGSFSTHVITTKAQAAGSVFAIDMDGDGDVDVLSASQKDMLLASRRMTGTVAYKKSAYNIFEWHENLDGNGGRFSTHTIANFTGGAANSVFAADIDSDGDIDVLTASKGEEGTVAWHENLGRNQKIEWLSAQQAHS